MKRFNRYSDFTLTVELTDTQGNPITPPGNPWEIHIADTAGTCWRCGFNGSEYEYCEIVDGKIVCFINNPGYVAGQLAITLHNRIPDTHFADGVYDQVTPLAEQIILWDGATDPTQADDIIITLAVLNPDLLTKTEAAETYDLKPIEVELILPDKPSVGFKQNYSEIRQALLDGREVIFRYMVGENPVTMRGYTSPGGIYFEGVQSQFAGNITAQPRTFYRCRWPEIGVVTIDTSTIYNLNDLATESTVRQNYLSKQDAASTYATKSEIPTVHELTQTEINDICV